MLAGCALAGPAPSPEPSPVRVDRADADLEAVYSAAMGRAGLSVRVASNGCTRKDDFEIQLLDTAPTPTVILKRVRPDSCRSLAAGGADLAFGFKELGTAPTSAITLANPIAPDPTPGR